MLMIGNDVVQQVLNMRECIEAQESAFKGLLTGGAIFRPRINMYAPCERHDGYYRASSVDAVSDGVFAVGDIRSRSIKRVAAGVGEGATVVSALHAYLARERAALMEAAQ